MIKKIFTFSSDTITLSIMKILIVEDELIISLAVSHMIERLGHRVIARAGSADEAYAAIEKEKPDLVLMDIHINGSVDGIDAAEVIKRRWGTSVAFASAYTDEETRKRADRVAPLAFIAKPLGPENLRSFFDSCMA